MSGTLHFRHEAEQLLIELVTLLHDAGKTQDEFDDMPEALCKQLTERVNTVMTCIFDNGYENGRLDVRDE